MAFYTQDEKIKLKVKTNRGRYTLLFMIILTLVDAFIVFTKGFPMMPFSSAISTYGIVYACVFRTKSTLFFAVGLAIAIIALTALVVCYLKSKKNIIFMVFSMWFVIIDSVVLIAYSLFNGLYDSILVVNIIIHGMTVFYFWSGINAYKELSKQTAENADNEYDIDIEDEDALENTEAPQGEETPLRPYIDDGTPQLLSGKISGLNAFVVIKNGVAMLIINNTVCGEQNIAENNDFELRIIVNDIDFSFQYKRLYNGETMYLYADDVLLDSLGRQ